MVCKPSKATQPANRPKQRVSQWIHARPQYHKALDGRKRPKQLAIGADGLSKNRKDGSWISMPIWKTILKQMLGQKYANNYAPRDYAQPLARTRKRLNAVERSKQK